MIGDGGGRTWVMVGVGRGIHQNPSNVSSIRNCFLTDRSFSRVLVSIECRFDGTRITINFQQPTSGSIFVKNHFSTCRNQFTSANEAVLNIPFPGALGSTGPGKGLDGTRECAGSQIVSMYFG